MKIDVDVEKLGSIDEDIRKIALISAVFKPSEELRKINEIANRLSKKLENLF